MPKTSSLMKFIRPFTRKGWKHWLVFVALLCGAGYAGHLLSSAAWLTPFRYKIYHWQLMMRDRSQLYPTRTALVLLDDNDYWSDRFQSRAPLKRDQLAGLMDSLRQAGVNTVALDVFLLAPQPLNPKFELSDYTKEDAKLLESIGLMCQAGRHVVLSSTVEFGDDGYKELPSIYTDHLKDLPCVSRGYIQLPFDLRRIPGSLPLANASPLDSPAPATVKSEDPAVFCKTTKGSPPSPTGDSLDSLSLAMVKIADPSAYCKAIEDTGHGFRFSEYLTEDDFGAKNGRKFIFSGQDLSAADGKQLSAAELGKLHEELADKLVIVGASWHTNAMGSGPLMDEHNSPGGQEPGAMLQANYVEAMLDRTGTFTPISDSAAEVLEVALALALATIGVLEIHTAWKWAAFGIGILLSILFTYTLLQNLGLFLDYRPFSCRGSVEDLARIPSPETQCRAQARA